jgi:hypothetical protein
MRNWTYESITIVSTLGSLASAASRRARARSSPAASSW